MGLKRPRWRFDLAQKYCQEADGDIKQIKFTKSDDKPLRDLTAYLCDKSCEKKVRELRKDYPYIHEAFELDQTRKNGYSEVWVLEALALGGLSNKDISQFIFCEPKVIETYCLCFYDLRDKDIKGRYINNIRLVCNSGDNVCTNDYIWKKKAAFNVDYFIRTVLNIDLMDHHEMDILDSNNKKLAMINANNALEKRNMLSDKIRPEPEVLLEKSDIDINVTLNSKKDDSSDTGETGKGLQTVLDLVQEQVTLIQPSENAEAVENRLTKQTSSENGKNVKKQ